MKRNRKKKQNAIKIFKTMEDEKETTIKTPKTKKKQNANKIFKTVEDEKKQQQKRRKTEEKM